MNQKSTSKRNRLRHFIGDGFWSSVCDGFAESNFITFITALAATPGQQSFLTSGQSLLGCWLQLWSEKWIAYLGSRKRLVIYTVSLQVFFLGLLMICTFIGLGVIPFLMLSLPYLIIGALAGSVWNSWISELLPSRRRGFCFGIRNQRTYPAQFAAILIAGFILQKAQVSWIGTRGIQIAFCSIFLLGLIAKILSLRHLMLQPETRFMPIAKSLSPFELLASGAKDPQMRKMVLFFGAMAFGISLSGPFTTSYMIQSLHFSYQSYSIVLASIILARFATAPFIGEVVDKMGYRKPLLFSSFLMPVIPLGWGLSRGVIGLCVMQLIGGVIWTAFDLSVFCFLTDSTSSEQRQTAFSLKQLSWNLASAAGALSGGILVSHFHTPYIAFWASTLGRSAAALLVIYMLGESLRPAELVLD